MVLAVPWLGSVHVGFLANIVALGQVFLQVIWLFPVSNVPLTLHTPASFGGSTTGPMVATVQRSQSHAIDTNNNNTDDTEWPGHVVRTPAFYLGGSVLSP
jgi:hypothetical protein